MRCSLREYACDAVCVNTYAIQFAWMRIRCSLRECACNIIYVFVKSTKSIKPSLFNPNDHCRFQIIMLIKTWFKSANQLIINSGINSLDLVNKIFCWYNYISKIRTKAVSATTILFKFNNIFILNYLKVLLKYINLYL